MPIWPTTAIRASGRRAITLWASWAALAAAHVAALAGLRAIWLLRPDPFGHPVVGKVDWYLFHGIAYDAVATVSALAFLAPIALGAAWLPEQSRGRSAAGVAAAVAVGSCALTALAQIDFEVMRFVGAHLGRALVDTYAGPGLLRELPRLLSSDAGGPFFGAALVIVAPVALGAVQWRMWRRPAGHARWAWAIVAAAAIGRIFTWLWPGSTWKVSAAAALVPALWGAAAPAPLPAAERAAAATEHEERWRRGHPGDPSVFAWPGTPLVHLSPHAACKAGVTGLDCAADRDGDGTPLARDCDDGRADVHPGAADRPSDGVDQDCSGADAAPWNFLVLVLESHRGMSVGHVPGAQSWSPQVDRIAGHGLAHGRAHAAGLPTIGAFMALHTGLLACAYDQIATQFTASRLPALPAVLGRHGYDTHFFSAFDPAFDNQNIWLRQWYAEVHYDRSREEDAPLLNHIGDWLAARTDPRPFFVAVTTRTNHFAFERVDGVPRTGGDGWADRMRDTMGYCDGAVGRLIRRVEGLPWFARTVVVVTGDHGYPLGEHGVWYLHQGLHVESTAVPLVFAGDHPLLRPLRGTVSMEPASHVDVAPTLLDLAGIDRSGAWAGRSLVRPGRGTALSTKDQHLAIERGRLRALFEDGRADRKGALLVYDRVADPREQRALPPSDEARAMAGEAQRASNLMRDLYRRDRILPPGWGPAGLSER